MDERASQVGTPGGRAHAPGRRAGAGPRRGPGAGAAADGRPGPAGHRCSPGRRDPQGPAVLQDPVPRLERPGAAGGQRAGRRARHPVQPDRGDPGDRPGGRLHDREPGHQGRRGLRPDRRGPLRHEPAGGPRGLHPRRWRLHGPPLRGLVGRPERARRQPVLPPPRRRDVRGPPRGPGGPPRPRRGRRHRQPADPGPAGEPHPQRRVVRLDAQPGPERAHPRRGRRDLLRHGPPGLDPPGHLVPADRRRSLLVHRHGPRGHRLLRDLHAHPDAPRPRLLRGPAPRRLLPAGQGRRGLVERRDAVAAGPDQHVADPRGHRAVLRQRADDLQRRHQVRLDRQRVRLAGRPVRVRRVGPGRAADPRERQRRARGQHDLHRPLLLDAGLQQPHRRDHDGRR